MTDTFDVETASRTLLQVWRGGTRPAGLPVPPPDTDAAYAVQRAVIKALGGGAWKMALLEGRDRHAAALPGQRVVPSGDTLLPLPRDAAIEVETALILGADLHTGADRETILAAIGEVRLCFEIVASRFADRKAVLPLVAMADGFSSGFIVLGEALPGWRDAMTGPLDIRLWIDDRLFVASETVQSLEEALSFLSWLTRHAADQNLPLRKGDVIITGARVGPIPLEGANLARARAGAATVSVGLVV